MTSKRQFDGEKVKLGEVITKAKVKRCGAEEYRVLSMTMHDGIIEQADRFKKSIASKDTSSYKVVNPGQLVVGFPIDEGVLYVQNFSCPGIMSPAYNIWDIDHGKVDSAYLELVLHGPRSMTYYKDKMRGTTARRRSITDSNLRALEIPLPSMETQKEIVALLQRVEIMRDVRATYIEKLDTLVKSRFVEMFGDPQAPSKSWPLKSLGDTCEIVTGNTPSRKDPTNYGDHIEWIKTDNISGDKYLTRAVECLSESGVSKGRTAPTGSVLMACIAGSIKSIGKVAVADRPVAFNQQINALIPQDDVLTDYLYWALKLSKSYLCSNVNMQLKGILNKTTLSAKELSVPPLPLQQQFADFVAKVDKPRFVAQQQIEKLQMLYDSLAQEYFG